jgi:hypothetical protein
MDVQFSWGRGPSKKNGRKPAKAHGGGATVVKLGREFLICPSQIRLEAPTKSDLSLSSGMISTLKLASTWPP